MIKIYSPYSNTLIGTIEALTQDQVNDAIKDDKKAQVPWAELNIYMLGQMN